MPEKKKSLSRKSIIRLSILGIILFLGTGLASGIQLYKENLKVLRDAAESYVNMLWYQIGSEDIDDIIAHEHEIRALYDQMEASAKEKDPDEEGVKKIWDEAGKETTDLYRRWSEIYSFVLGFGNICKDIRYAYVVIPRQDELVYIWDSDMENSTESAPFEHEPYVGKEKDHLMAVMNGDAQYDFFTDTVGREQFGTELCPVYDFNGRICAVAAIDISISSLRAATRKLLLNIGLAILLIMLVSIMIYHYVVRRQIIDPIVTLTRSADGLVNNLQKEGSEPFLVDVHTGDEIDVLARSFERMDEKLRDYIQENAAITAEKERIGTELSLAARIQMDMLPRSFPPFPDVKEIDLYASMDPAKEVGGDFYDFFMDDGDRLWLAMADVSGKGIPAALFMMMSKFMLQNFAMTMDSPAQVLEKVNDQICANTEEEMFVTVWMGVLDLKTGLLTAANAGHEYPVLMEPGGDFELIRDKHGPVVGAIPGIHYREYQMQLKSGTRLFFYTDGLPEATDDDNQMFGIERTLNALNEVKDAPPGEVLDHVTKSVAAFVGSAPQFDDTTMLCLDYYGR